MKHAMIFFAGLVLSSLLYASDDLWLKNEKSAFCFDANSGALKKVVCEKNEFPVLGDAITLVTKDGKNICGTVQLKKQYLAGSTLRQIFTLPGWEIEVDRKLLPDSTTLSRQCSWKRTGETPVSIKAIRMSLTFGPSGKPEDCLVTHPCNFPAEDILLSSAKTIRKKSGGEHLPGILLYQSKKKLGLSYSIFSCNSDFEIVSETGRKQTAFTSTYNIRTAMKSGDSCKSGSELLSVGQGSLNDLAATLPLAWERSGFKLKTRPEWTRGAVLYSAYVQGTEASRYLDIGTLENFRKDVLPHLQNLGVSILWFNPFNQGRYGLRSFDFEEEVGNEADLKRLTEDAQKRGIRVLMDLILHGPSPKAGSLAPWMIKEHPEWISRDAKGKFKFWWGGYCMDYANTDYQNFMAKFAAGYLERCGITGWRVDCARQSPDNEQPTGGRIPSQSGTEGALKMMQRISGELKKVDKQSILLGETHTTVNLAEMEFIYDTRVCGSYFTQLITRKPVQFVPMLKKFFARDNAAFPVKYSSGLMRYSENHDSSRTLRRYGSGHRDAYLGLTFLIPGLPLVNMEQERGAELLIRKLAEIRKRPEFIAGQALYEETLSSQPGVFSFTRCLDKQFSVVAVNFCGQTLPLTLTVPEKCDVSQGKFRELVHNTKVQKNGRKLTLSIQPYQTCVIAFAPEMPAALAVQAAERKPLPSKNGKEVLANRFWKIAFENGFPVSVRDRNGREIAPAWHIVADHRLIRDGKEKNLRKNLTFAAPQRQKKGESETLTFTGKQQNGKPFSASYTLNGKDFSVKFTGLPTAAEGALEVSFGNDPAEWFVSALEGALHGAYDVWHSRGDEFTMHEKDLWLRHIRITHIVQKSGVLYEASAQPLHPRTGQLAVKKANSWVGVRFLGEGQRAYENLFLREMGTLGEGLTMRLTSLKGDASFILRAGDTPQTAYGWLKTKERVFYTDSSRHAFRNKLYEFVLNRNQGGNTSGLFFRGKPLLWSSRIFSDDGFFFPKVDPERSRIIQTLGSNFYDLEAAMRIEEQGECVNLTFAGEIKKDGGHCYSALPKTGYRINWILDDSGRIRCRVFIDAKAVEAYQLKEPGAAYENLKGNLCQEFRLSGSNTSVRVYQKGNTKTVQLKGTSDTELFRSSELPEKLIFYGEDGKENFRIVDLAMTPNGSLVISRQKGVPCLRISLLKANGRKIEQKAEFSCDFILQ